MRIILTILLVFISLQSVAQVKKDSTQKDTTWVTVLSMDETKALKEFIDKTSKAPHPEVPNVLKFIDSRKRIVDIKARQ